MAYERIILDIETTNLLEPMIDFTQRPLALKPDAKLWCIAVKCIDTNNSFVMISPEILEEIEDYDPMEHALIADDITIEEDTKA